MAQYYYFVASLPSLVFSAPPSVTQEWFVEESARNLESNDHAELVALLDSRIDDVTTEFSRQWLSGDRQLRNAVAKNRALSRGIDEKKYIKQHVGFRVDAEAAVSDAYSRANPKERELALDRYRWSLADELSLESAFGLAAVLAYAVKLRISQRWQPLTSKIGREKLDELIEIVGVSSREVSGWSGLSQV